MSWLRVILVNICLLPIAASALAAISVNGPSRIGVPLNKPFVFLIPASGSESLVYRADGLPRGLSLNSRTGVITGEASRQGSFRVTFRVATHQASASKVVEMVVDSKPATLALTPPMGWNPWYVWGCNIDDGKIRQAADLLVSSGLAAYGYNYINLDDCWQGGRNSRGEIVPNRRFPDMKALADYVHSKGLRIGIYTGPGEKTCAGFPASKGHLEKDVMTYASWGMDFIKYDWCQRQPRAAAPYYNAYREMGRILARAPRAMTYMICEYGNGQPWRWGATVGGNMWRTDHDLADVWEAILRNGFGRVELSRYASPGHWNDLDMLMVGKGNWPLQLGTYAIKNGPPRPTKLTLDEQKTHMSLWSMMASPLLFSGDLSQLDSVTMQMLTNKDILDLNQDSLGAPVRKVLERNDVQVLVRNLADGSRAVAFFNLSTVNKVARVTYQSLGLPVGPELKFRNLWTKREIRSEAGHRFLRTTIPAHGVAVFRVSAK